MTAIYNKDGIEFLYPENWKLTEVPQTGDIAEISLESPSGSIWSVSLFPDSAIPAELLESSATALRDQYHDLELTEFHGQLETFATLGFDADFYCLDFLVTAQARTFPVPDYILHVYCQAESREFDSVKDVFDAITLSLLKSNFQTG